MKTKTLLALLACATLSLTLKAQSLIDRQHLDSVRQHLDDPYYAAAYARLTASADRLLTDSSTPVGPSVEQLSLAWYLSRNDSYASRAAELLRTSFVNTDTRLAPDPAQIADSYSFIAMLDGVQLLDSSQALTKSDRKALQKWFSQLLDALSATQPADSLATAHDAQLIAFALYTGKDDLARQTALAASEKPIPTDERNLACLLDILQMARHMGLQLDSLSSACRALDRLAQAPTLSADLCTSLLRAAKLTGSSHFLRLYRDHRTLDFSRPEHLLYFEPTLVDNAYAHAAGQLTVMAQATRKALREPDNARRRRVSPRTETDGKLSLVHPHDWCSGFFPGSLWQMYEWTRDRQWRAEAVSFTWPIEEAKVYRGTHDLGFMIFDSFGRAMDLTGEESFRDVVLQTARTLITRYKPSVGCIRSWDFNADVWQCPVIIDNMLNLELLFRATQLTGDSTYHRIAVSHANTTMKNHFRDDFSTFHVVDYDTITGEVRMRCTSQGEADDSWWSRGQAWAIYGYAMCYRFTRDEAYLRQSQAVADWWMKLDAMPDDLIPYWDMRSRDIPNTSRDAAAATIIASGLYELAHHLGEEQGQTYRAYADRIVQSLYDHYRAEPGTHNGFVLLHSTGHHPDNYEVDAPLSYTDYFWLEALHRKALAE